MIMIQATENAKSEGLLNDDDDNDDDNDSDNNNDNDDNDPGHGDCQE